MNTSTWAQFINHWAQTFAIAVGGIWIFGYQFLYKDWYLESQKPSHINIQIEHKIYPAQGGLIPVSFDIHLFNESEKEVQLLPGLFVVWGIDNKTLVTPFNSFTETVANSANEGESLMYNKFVEPTKMEVVNSGGFGGELILSAREKYKSSYLVYIPQHKFNAIEAKVHFWAHTSLEELWTEIQFENNSHYNIAPCQVISTSPWSCDTLSVYDNNNKTNKQYDLWEFEADELLPLTEGKAHMALPDPEQ